MLRKHNMRLNKNILIYHALRTLFNHLVLQVHLLPCEIQCLMQTTITCRQQLKKENKHCPHPITRTPQGNMHYPSYRYLDRFLLRSFSSLIFLFLSFVAINSLCTSTISLYFIYNWLYFSFNISTN